MNDPTISKLFTHTHLTTSEAAHCLNLKPQTLIIWKCERRGLMQPLKVGRRLLWSTQKIREILQLDGEKND